MAVCFFKYHLHPLCAEGGEIISFVGVGLARGPATLADTQDPPCADETDSGKVWRVCLAGTVGWVLLAGGPATLADGRDPPLHAGRAAPCAGLYLQVTVTSVFAGVRLPGQHPAGLEVGWRDWSDPAGRGDYFVCRGGSGSRVGHVGRYARPTLCR